jgi:hypothetical protein
VNGSGGVRVDGEPNGLSDVGDDDSDEDKDDGNDGKDVVGVGGICEAVIVADRSLALVNCPRKRG